MLGLAANVSQTTRFATLQLERVRVVATVTHRDVSLRGQNNSSHPPFSMGYNAEPMIERLHNDPVLKRFRAALTEIYGERLERTVLYGSPAAIIARIPITILPSSSKTPAIFPTSAHTWPRSARIFCSTLAQSSPPHRFRPRHTASAQGSCTNCVRTAWTYEGGDR